MTSKKNRLINQLMYSWYISKIAGDRHYWRLPSKSYDDLMKKNAPMATDLMPDKTAGWLESKSD